MRVYINQRIDFIALYILTIANFVAMVEVEVMVMAMAMMKARTMTGI